MGEALSERLVEFEAGLTRFASDNLSCLESTRLSYLLTTLERTKIYIEQGSNQLALILLEKVERSFQRLQFGFDEKGQCASEESDEQRIDPAKQFILLKQEIQKSRLSYSNSHENKTHQTNKTGELKLDSDLQSFKEYQVMFEKMALDRLLAKVMQQIPENAGPLNPERLVIRSFKALQDISPEYLSHLISYYESLLILQAVNSTFR